MSDTDYSSDYSSDEDVVPVLIIKQIKPIKKAINRKKIDTSGCKTFVNILKNDVIMVKKKGRTKNVVKKKQVVNNNSDAQIHHKIYNIAEHYFEGGDMEQAIIFYNMFIQDKENALVHKELVYKCIYKLIDYYIKDIGKNIEHITQYLELIDYCDTTNYLKCIEYMYKIGQHYELGNLLTDAETYYNKILTSTTGSCIPLSTAYLVHSMKMCNQVIDFDIMPYIKKERDISPNEKIELIYETNKYYERVKNIDQLLHFNLNIVNIDPDYRKYLLSAANKYIVNNITKQMNPMCVEILNHCAYYFYTTNNKEEEINYYKLILLGLSLNEINISEQCILDNMFRDIYAYYNSDVDITYPFFSQILENAAFQKNNNILNAFEKLLDDKLTSYSQFNFLNKYKKHLSSKYFKTLNNIKKNYYLIHQYKDLPDFRKLIN